MTGEWTTGALAAQMFLAVATRTVEDPSPRCACGAPLSDVEDVLCEPCHQRRPVTERVQLGDWTMEARRLRLWMSNADERLREADTLEARAKQIRMEVANSAYRAVSTATDCPEVILLGHLVAAAVRR